MLGQFILAAIVSIGSGYNDLKVRRIPNLITLPGILSGFILNTVLSGFNGFKISLIGFLIGFCFFLVLYLIGGMGAGDVKLMGAIGAIMGYPLIINVFIFTAISSLIIIIFMFFPIIYGSIKMKDFSTLKSIRKTYIPYGLAISGGTIITIVLKYLNIFNIHV